MRMRVCCPHCFASDEHCDWCGGMGLVCPTCTGSGWLARHRRQTTSELVRCPDCGLEMAEGWRFDADKMLQTVERYLDQWFNGIAIDDRITHDREVGKERAEFEASRSPSAREALHRMQREAAARQEQSPQSPMGESTVITVEEGVVTSVQDPPPPHYAWDAPPRAEPEEEEDIPF